MAEKKEKPKKRVTKKTAKKAVKKKVIKKSSSKQKAKIVKKSATKDRDKESKTKKRKPAQKKRKLDQPEVVLPTNAGPRLVSKVAALESFFDTLHEPIRKISYVSAYCFVAIGLVAIATSYYQPISAVSFQSNHSTTESSQNLPFDTKYETISFQSEIPKQISETAKIALRTNGQNVNAALLNLTTNQITNIAASQLSNENQQFIIEPDFIASGLYSLRLLVSDEAFPQVVYSDSFTILPTQAVAGISTSSKSTIDLKPSESEELSEATTTPFELNIPSQPVLGEVVISARTDQNADSVFLYKRMQGDSEFTLTAEFMKLDSHWFVVVDTSNFVPGKYDLVAVSSNATGTFTSEPQTLIIPKRIVLGASTEVEFTSTTSSLLEAELVYELATAATTTDTGASYSSVSDLSTLDSVQETAIDNVSTVLITKPNSSKSAALQVQGTAQPDTYLELYIAGNPYKKSILVNDAGLFNTVMTVDLEDGLHDLVAITLAETGEIARVSDVVRIHRKDNQFFIAGQIMEDKTSILNNDNKFYVESTSSLIKIVLGIFVVSIGFVLIMLSVSLRNTRKPKVLSQSRS